jgi:phosphatidylglycerol:prolipoprotein diacylglycerol transferase
MYPKFSDIINDFFGTSLNLPIQTYGLFVALAFVAGGWIVYLELKRKEKEQIIFPFEKEVKAKGKPGRELVTVHPSQLTTSIILVAAIFGILGSKLFDVVEHLDELVKDPLGTLFSFSGLAFYGGLITAAFAVGIYAERNKIPWPVIADVVAPALMLAYGIGRIGCQLAGDGCWGVVNLAPKPEWMGFLPDWMWAFNYPNNVLNAGNLIPGCDGPHCHVLGQPVFPTPFYETMIALLFFGVLWSIRKKIRIHGYLFSIYLVLNGMERIFIEQLRVNIRYDFLGMKVTQAAVIAVGLMVVGTAGFFYFHWRNKNGPLVSINE